MRILGWMHRKLLRQNNATDAPKDFTIGGDPLVDSKPTLIRNSHKAHCPQTSFLRLNECEEQILQEFFTYWQNDFLAIGTLGTDPAGLESIQELEREDPNGKTDPQGTLNALCPNGGLNEEESTNDGRPEECHVMESTVDFRSTASPMGPVPDPKVDGSQGESGPVPPRKEHRISLGELLSKGKPDDTLGELGARTMVKTEGPSKATHGLVEKILKRSRIRPSKSSTSSDYVPPDNRIHKLFHMFNRKVHPSELCTTPKKCNREDAKSNTGGGTLGEWENFIHIDPVTGRQKSLPHKGQQVPPIRICGIDSNSNRECWIKTDEDYLVLEL